VRRTAYERILTMCLKRHRLSEERLLKNIVEAFPIMLFKMQLPTTPKIHGNL
jgi:pilus assembly protein CpaF